MLLTNSTGRSRAATARLVEFNLHTAVLSRCTGSTAPLALYESSFDHENGITWPGVAVRTREENEGSSGLWISSFAAAMDRLAI